MYSATDNTADEVQSIQSPPTGSIHSSSSLRDEDEGLLSLFSESNSSIKTDSCPPAVDTHVEPSDSYNTHSLGDLNRFRKPDNTVLLNQTMDMTLSDTTEIVTVDSKVKKMGHPSRAKTKKKNKQTCSWNKADSQAKNWTHSTKSHVENTDAEEPTLRDRNPEDSHQLATSQSLNVVNSHVFKKNKKRSKIKLKSQQTEQDPKVCNVSLNPDDISTDPTANLSNICLSRTPLLEGDGAEDGVKSNITCRRSKAKGKVGSVPRKTLVVEPFLVGEPDVHFDAIEKAPGTKPDSLVDGHQIRRQTFVISDHSSPQTASPGAGLSEEGARTVTVALDQLVSQTTSCSSQSNACSKTSRHEKKSLDKMEAIQKRKGTCKEKKKSNGRCLDNEKLTCSDKAQFVVDEINNTNIESEVVGRSLLDRRAEDGSSEQFYGLGMDMLKLHIPSEPRNLRSTFVIHKLEDPLDSRQSVLSDVSSHMMDTRHELENFEDILMDERPPWVNTDVPLTDPEEALSFPTPRRKTTDRTLLNSDSESATEATPGG